MNAIMNSPLFPTGHVLNGGAVAGAVAVETNWVQAFTLRLSHGRSLLPKRMPSDRWIIDLCDTACRFELARLMAWDEGMIWW